jgi:hypothetical protein
MGVSESAAPMAVRLTIAAVLILGATSIVPPQAEARTGPKVSLKVSTRQADLGEKIAFSGRVRPNRTGESVFIQQLSDHNWRNIAHTPLGSGSSFLVRTGLHTAGVLSLRALYPGCCPSRSASTRSNTW